MKVPFLKLIVRKIRQSIAIVEEGDTCTHTGGLAVGKYVIWKGTLCKVTTAIQNGATISASSLSVVDDGIANELNSNMQKKTWSKLELTGTTVSTLSSLGYYNEAIFQFELSDEVVLTATITRETTDRHVAAGKVTQVIAGAYYSSNVYFYAQFNIQSTGSMALAYASNGGTDVKNSVKTTIMYR